MTADIPGREIQAHVPEDFWQIQVSHTGQDHRKTDFSWDRGRLFDHTAATVLYEMCVEEPLATVTKVSFMTLVPASQDDTGLFFTPVYLCVLQMRCSIVSFTMYSPDCNVSLRVMLQHSQLGRQACNKRFARL